MRVLALTLDYLPRRRIGSEVATHEVLRALASRGHTVTVAPTLVPPSVAPWSIDGVLVVPGLTDYAAHQADVIWAHAELLPRVASVGAPVVASTHNTRTSVVLGMRAPADLFVHNAAHTRDALIGYAPRSEHMVCHPIVRPAEYRARGPHDHVTIVGRSPAKGISALAALARKRPRDRFLAVQGAYGRQVMVRRPNVECHPHVEDMRGVYARTRVLIVPSAHESYGRVAVEAMCSGIPVLASDLPGLREACGNAAVYLSPSRHPEWVKALADLDDPAVYRAAQRRSRAQAKALTPDKDLAAVVTAVERLVEAPCRAAAG